MLDRYPQLIGSHGTLYSVPNRDMLLAYPANDISVVAAVNTITMLTIQAHAERSEQLSRQLYWRMPDGALRMFVWAKRMAASRSTYVPPTALGFWC